MIETCFSRFDFYSFFFLNVIDITQIAVILLSILVDSWLSVSNRDAVTIFISKAFTKRNEKKSENHNWSAVARSAAKWYRTFLFHQQSEKPFYNSNPRSH